MRTIFFTFSVCVCVHVFVCVNEGLAYERSLHWFLRLFGKGCWQFKWGWWYVLCLWISQLLLLLLMWILLIILIKCWMLSFTVCVSFIWYFKPCIKRKLLYFALLWIASHGAFYQPFIVPVYAFLCCRICFLFYYWGGKHIHCPAPLLDIDWNIYSAYAFCITNVH